MSNKRQHGSGSGNVKKPRDTQQAYNLPVASSTVAPQAASRSSSSASSQATRASQFRQIVQSGSLLAAEYRSIVLPVIVEALSDNIFVGLPAPTQEQEQSRYLEKADVRCAVAEFVRDNAREPRAWDMTVDLEQGMRYGILLEMWQYEIRRREKPNFANPGAQLVVWLISGHSGSAASDVLLLVMFLILTHRIRLEIGLARQSIGDRQSWFRTSRDQTGQLIFK